MLSLILAMSVAAQSPATTASADMSQLPVAVAKVAKIDRVKCKWVVTKSGMARQFCLTNRDWRDHQIERQQRIDEFTKRQLQIRLAR